MLARIAAVVAIAGSIALTSALPADPAAAAPLQDAITPPAKWATWDDNSDGRLTIDEYDQMSEADQEELQDWIDATLDEVDDNDFRDWANDHFDYMVALFEVDIPSEGIGDSVREIPGDVKDAVTGVAKDAASGAADSAFEAVANRVGEAASDLTGYIGDEMARTGRPQLEADWYVRHYQRMLGWAGLFILPLAALGIGGAVAKGDSAKVGHIMLQVPIAYLLGVLAISAVSASSGLAAAMSRSLVPGMQDASHKLGERVAVLMTGQLGPGLVLLLGLVIAIAAIVTLMWLLLAEAAIYAVVLFIPLAFAGRVWEPARDWGRKLLTFAFSLVAAKVVIFAIWALAVDGLADASAADVPLRSTLALAALLLMTAIAPSAALRLIPMLEGVERAGSPGAAMRSGLSTTYYAGGLARMRGGASLGAGRGGGAGGTLAVTGQIGGAAARAPSAAARRVEGMPSSRSKTSDATKPPTSTPGTAQRDGSPRSTRGPRPGSPGGPSRETTSSETPRAAPPAPPPGMGSGKPWRRES